MTKLSDAARARLKEANLDKSDFLLTIDLGKLAAKRALESVDLVADRHPNFRAREHIRRFVLQSFAEAHRVLEEADAPPPSRPWRSIVQTTATGIGAAIGMVAIVASVIAPDMRAEDVFWFGLKVYGLAFAIFMFWFFAKDVLRWARVRFRARANRGRRR